MGKSTTRILVQLATDSQATADDIMPQALEYHTKVVSKVATHIQRTAANIGGRSHWIAAGMLNTDLCNAKIAASTWLEHLKRKPDNMLTRFGA